MFNCQQMDTCCIKVGMYFKTAFCSIKYVYRLYYNKSGTSL